MTKLTELRDLAQKNDLVLLGLLHRNPEDPLPAWCETLVLLGPTAEFWTSFVESAEWKDKAPDPMDRWSQRVITALASQVKGEALFPFGGPPFLPFYSWALRSGQAWASPVHLLVHETAGLMVSYRGAIALRERLPLPETTSRPCATCTQPCLETCVPRALTSSGYDVPTCKNHLATDDGADSMKRGCAVRRACPVSQSYARMDAQSAYHMRVFVGESR